MSADGPSGGRRASSGRKEVPQFAPNFSVYVLPPDIVCLYSDDRKFFLHGELYCALASAIGKGGKSLPELAHELGRNFPPDQVEEARQQANLTPIDAGVFNDMRGVPEGPAS